MNKTAILASFKKDVVTCKLKEVPSITFIIHHLS